MMQMQILVNKCEVLTLSGGHNGDNNCEVSLFDNVIHPVEVVRD